MKKARKRGIPIPNRIIISGILLLLQLALFSGLLYNYSTTSAVAYTISVFIAIITVIFIINRRGNPDHKISWLAFILIFPIFGIIVFMLWGGGRVLPHIKRRMRACDTKYKNLLKENSNVCCKR